MKKILTVGVVCLLGLSAAAQYVPDRMNYQAVLTDSSGTPQCNVTNAVKFRIYDEAESGNLIWGEQHSVTTSPKGLFSVVLGTGTSLGESTTAANLREAFASATLIEQRYLELQAMNADGTAQSPLLPRQRFLTVPYVFQANDAQSAAGDFRVCGALYADQVGMRAGRVIMTNKTCSVTVAGDMRVIGSELSAVTASFVSNCSVRSTASDALRNSGNLVANADMTVGGAATFYGGLTAADPVFKKGASVKGGIRALGSYKCLGASISSNWPSRTATGDGFLLVYFKTDGWNKDADLMVNIASNEVRLKHENHSSGDKRGIHFYDTACFPVAKDSTWFLSWSSGDHGSSTYDLYWIPFGY